MWTIPYPPDAGGRRSIRIAAFLLTLIFFALACGEPWGPAPDGWAKIMTVPTDVDIRAFSGGWTGVYAVGADYREGGGGAAVFELVNGVFEAESLNVPGELYAIGQANSLWVAGEDWEGEATTPLIYTNQHGEKWHPWPTAGLPAQPICKIIPTYQEGCWVLSATHSFNGDHVPAYGILARCSASGARVYYEFGEVLLAASEHSGFGGEPVLYAVDYDYHAYEHGKTLKVHITADNGATRAEEAIPSAIGGRRLVRVRRAAATESALYLLADFADRSASAEGIVKRTGPAGAGEYELVFLSYGAPYYANTQVLAARSEKALSNSGVYSDLLAAGEQTTVVFRNGEVRLEALPFEYYFRSLSYGGSITDGFFALARNSTLRSEEVLYHP
jgi:hypothetical protein